MTAIEHHDNTSGIRHVVSVKRGIEKCISKIPKTIQHTTSAKVCPPWNCLYPYEAFIHQINHRTLRSRGGLGFVN